MTRQPCGLIGLGLLGSALAERLLHAGFPISGFDLDPRRLDHFRDLGGKPVASARDAAACPRFLFSLPTTDVVEAVLADIDGSLHAGQILLDTTTGDPERTAAIGDRLAERGIRYLDATVAGSSEQVRQGQAIILLGGNAEAVRACDDL